MKPFSDFVDGMKACQEGAPYDEKQSREWCAGWRSEYDLEQVMENMEEPYERLGDIKRNRLQ